jgi:hypothetical protein
MFIACQLEARARSRARLEEQIDNRLAAQGGHLFDLSLGYFLERVSGIEDDVNLFGAQALESQHVLSVEMLHSFVSPRTTSSASSSSVR